MIPQLSVAERIDADPHAVPLGEGEFFGRFFLKDFSEIDESVVTPP